VGVGDGGPVQAEVGELSAGVVAGGVVAGGVVAGGVVAGGVAGTEPGLPGTGRVARWS
jgi:hypothetical protein